MTLWGFLALWLILGIGWASGAAQPRYAAGVIWSGVGFRLWHLQDGGRDG